ncbi:MAG: hypothetical protein RLW87_04845 [Alphaproteobacteria bacterium]|jgi:hypothetical protein|uniref:hypothetical protein n=1 Tax=Pacificispira sp. TaxID=2888761 RepID=UPI001B1CB5EC|nr:hypothetical protein [Alphaproteobacteria bacterium]MBO6863322.1 hypothetical protein [Alphaproteobacteria bacterium]MEC9265777.1 hypothetical protein [Pseudomonadota bacterium]
MKMVLLVALIDVSRVGEFMPAQQYYQYVPEYQCEMTRDYYKDDPYRVTLCLDAAALAADNLTVDEMIALVRAG